MDISELTVSVPRFESVVASQLFYGLYRYCVRFSIRYLSCLRGIEPDLDTYCAVVAQRFEYRTRSGRLPEVWRTKRYGVPWHTTAVKSWAAASKQSDITEYLANLLDLTKTVHSLAPHIKFVCMGDFGYLYTNDAASLARFQNKTYLEGLHYREVKPDRVPGVITLLNSDYAYRTFFRNRYLTTERRQLVANFLINNRDGIRISPSLTRWLEGKLSSYRQNWLESYYFFDHLTAHEPMMLNLASPGLVRQTLPIHVVNN